jgi:putative ABC transport system permease protein
MTDAAVEDERVPLRNERAGAGLAFRLAGRELRGGVKGFRVFLLCLALGVAIIAAVGSLAAMVTGGIAANARTLLGGDIELRRVYRPAEPETLERMAGTGTVSRLREMRAMARADEGDGLAQLVELKAVDDAYPLYGAMAIAGAPSLAAALGEQDGVWGAAADPALLERLDLELGDRIRVGDAVVVLRATIGFEPDRGAQIFSLGPRLMIADRSLESTGLVVPGSLVYYGYRVRAEPGAALSPAELAAEFANRDWRVRDLSDAGPGLRRFLRSATLFLGLVGLATLLIGGVGVGNAVAGFLERRAGTIAILKSVGATSGIVYRTYLLLVLALALGGVAIGVAAGAGLAALAAPILGPELGVDMAAALYPAPLIEAAGMGLLVALLFSLWPLAKSRAVSPAELFRGRVALRRWQPRLADLLALGATGLALGAVALFVTPHRGLALGFLGGAVVAFALFRGLAALLAWGARRLARQARKKPGLRLALANIARPGAPTASVTLSLGLALTVLVLVGLAQGSLTQQIRATLPETAPSFYFIDIQQAQQPGFKAAIEATPTLASYREVPMLRGRITAVNGVPAERLTPAPGSEWVLQGDRGITWGPALPAGSRLAEGEWWPAGYRGPPLVSFEAEAAAGLGHALGDKITVNVLGREVTATLANIRTIRWTDLTINFVMVFTPDAFAGAPATYLATASVAPDRETALERRLIQAFPNVSMIRVKDALAAVDRILSAIGTAVAATAGATLVAGLAVLGSALLAAERSRAYDAVLLKVLGATRRDVAAAFFLEHGLLGFAAAALAILIGSIGAFLVVTLVLGGDWVFLPGLALLIAVGGSAAALLLGFAGILRALSSKAADHLRNE